MLVIIKANSSLTGKIKQPKYTMTFPNKKRMTFVQRIEKLNKIPEKSTPAPNAYKLEKRDLILPNINGGGHAGASAKAKKISL